MRLLSNHTFSVWDMTPGSVLTSFVAIFVALFWDQTFIQLKIKVLHDAIDRRTFLSKWFHKEPLTSEEPF